MQPTRMGDVSRRGDPTTGDDVSEVLLGEEFLCRACSPWLRDRAVRLALRALQGNDLDVAVGGFGLEWTVDALPRRVRGRWGADTRTVTPPRWSPLSRD